MASRNRDLTIALIAKADKFDLKGPTQDLEKIGDAAKQTGDDFDKTRKDLDGFIDKMKKIDGGQVKRELDRAGDGMRDLKDEAGQSGREAAASFSGGFDSVTDFMQETAANALAGFGAVGGALGLAAAAGMGFLANKAQEAAENIKSVKDSLVDLYKSGDTTGRDKTEQFLEFLSEAGSGLDTGLTDALKRAGVTIEEFTRAGAEGGPVYDEVKRKLRGLGDEYLGLGGILGVDYVNAAQGAIDLLDQQREGASQASTEVENQAKATETARIKQEEYNAELQALADAHHAETFGAIEEGIRAVGDASGEVAAAVAEDGQVQIDTLTETLREATKAALEHQGNVKTALKEGGAEFAEWVSQQGPEVSQAYVNGSAKERAALREAFENNVGAQMGGGIASGLQRTKGAVEDAAGNVYTAVENTMTGETILIPTEVGKPNNTGTVLRDVQNNMKPVVIPVMLQNVPRPTLSRFIP